MMYMNSRKIDSIWYDIIRDGKVIIVKKEYLAQYQQSNESIKLVITCDDGSKGEMEIKYYQGLPERVYQEYQARMPYLFITPTPTLLVEETLQPTPTLTPTPALSEAELKLLKEKVLKKTAEINKI